MGRKAIKRPKNLGSKLEQIRKRIGVTQAKMAELLRRFGAEETTHSGYVADFETSQRVPSVFTLLAYSRMTGISINYFVDDCLDLPEQVIPEENWWVMESRTRK
jgi:transcriptional regulator with XRE-family HTH domain